MKVAALLLAAGHSRRFGTANKLLALHQGRPLVTFAADAIRASDATHHVATVRDTRVADLLDDFDCVHLGPDQDDQSASLRTGVERCLALSPDHILIVLADMPGVTAVHLNAVIKRCSGEEPSATVHEGKAMPPACFPAAFASQLLSLSGDTGAAQWLRDLPARSLEPGSDALVWDIDRPEDLS